MKWAILQFHEHDTEMDEYEDYEKAKKAYEEMIFLGYGTVYLVEIKESKEYFAGKVKSRS